MSSKIPFPSMAPGVGWLRFWLPLFALLHGGNAHAACQSHNIPLLNCAAAQKTCICGPLLPCGPNPPEASYAGAPSATINQQVFVDLNTAVVVTWKANATATCSGPASGSGPLGCFPNGVVAITLPPVGQNNPVNISGVFPDQVGAEAKFSLTVSGPGADCPRTYDLHVTGAGGGWGDPHIATVDGKHYDFQGAGEFTFLRGDGLEIQTRQTPVATAPAFPNDYTGLRTCVSLYSAVAARVGKHRVSYQPNISGVPDPSGLQLRVDGVLTKLGPEGIDLDGDNDEASPTPGAIVERPSAGRIVKSPAGGGIEIHYADGTKLVVAPDFWPAQQKWYLNVIVFETTATKGIMGLTKDAWLPALPDGASLGPQPEPLHERYVHLYEKFADAWRVTDYTSLFYYAEGTSTQTFTNRNWPSESPKSCAIEGEPTAQPIDAQVAEKHCSAVVDKNNKANCIFDVRVTGNPGFAQTYQTSEQLDPGLTRTAVKDDRDPTNYGETVSFTATVVPTLPRGPGAPGGAVQFNVDGAKVCDPVMLDLRGQAAWSTTSCLQAGKPRVLQAGKHRVVASYIPSGFGGTLFRASSSPEESFTVVPPSDLRFWLIVLLGVIILIVLIVWWFRTK